MSSLPVMMSIVAGSMASIAMALTEHSTPSANSRSANRSARKARTTTGKSARPATPISNTWKSPGAKKSSPGRRTSRGAKMRSRIRS